MNTFKYRVLVETARHGSLSLAAAALQYTQPGISHIISSMESEYGFALFDRTRSGVTLTENGRRICALCRQILEIEDELEDTVHQVNGSIAGRIRIGSFFSTMTSWCPDAIALLSERYPQLELSVYGCDPAEMAVQIRSGSVDLAVGTLENMADCDFIPLREDPSVVVLPHGHPLTAYETLRPEQLLDYPLIAQPGLDAQELKAAFGSRYASIKPRYIIKHDPAMIRMVEMGLGIGVTSEILILPYYSVETRHFTTPVSRTLGLILPAWKTVSPAMQAVVQVFRELFEA